MDLRHLFAVAADRGWAIGDNVAIDELTVEAVSRGWTVVPTRRGSDSVSRLRPTSRELSAAPSLSAKYGFGVFPLHSDGAHLMHPPDFVVLAADAPSTTPTLLWKVEVESRAFEDDLLHGIFRVTGGGRPFLASAKSEGRLRFDPGCMISTDRRARRVTDFFATAIDRATHHHWTREGEVLVIDNRRALHARADATDDQSRSLRRVMLRDLASS